MKLYETEYCNILYIDNFVYPSELRGLKVRWAGNRQKHYTVKLYMKRGIPFPDALLGIVSEWILFVQLYYMIITVLLIIINIL